MTKNYPTEVLLSITTGILLCDFGKMHECCEFLVGCTTYTHQFAFRPFVDKLRDSVLCQHPHLSTVNVEGVGEDNWEDFRDRMVKKFGAELPLVPMSLCSDEDLRQSSTEPLANKQVIAIEAKS